MEDNTSVEKESVIIMARAKSYLDGIPVRLQNSDYKDIVDSVNQYLKTYCKHKIVMDLVDITPDCCRTIYYCENCYSCFDSLVPPEKDD
jgi:hypothetical protein